MGTQGLLHMQFRQVPSSLKLPFDKKPLVIVLIKGLQRMGAFRSQ